LREDLFPPMPSFSDELIQRCSNDEDAMPLMFEWYKYVGAVCNIVASVDRRSPAFRSILPVHFAILTGLLNRCSRLMLANIRLAATGLYRETTRILDRCMAETAVKIQWLCLKHSDESFGRYLADGLAKDLLLKDAILDNISERDGGPLVIEKRMLESIQYCLESAGLTEARVRESKKLPDLFSMCRDLGLEEIFYTVSQRIGSHAVHGTWTDLVFHYLEGDEKGAWHLRDHDVKTHENQFMFVSLLILHAMKAFIEYLSDDPELTEEFVGFFEEIVRSIMQTSEISLADDFEIVGTVDGSEMG